MPTPTRTPTEVDSPGPTGLGSSTCQAGKTVANGQAKIWKYEIRAHVGVASGSGYGSGVYVGGRGLCTVTHFGTWGNQAVLMQASFYGPLSVAATSTVTATVTVNEMKTTANK